jgi:glutaredoxin
VQSGGAACAARELNQGRSRLQLLRRPDCGLCEDMARDLHRLRVDFEEVDIEQDAALDCAYGESIPVLLAGDEEIARAPQTERSLKDALVRAGLLPAVR